jgi:hypothetical protein
VSRSLADSESSRSRSWPEWGSAKLHGASLSEGIGPRTCRQAGARFWPPLANAKPDQPISIR